MKRVRMFFVVVVVAVTVKVVAADLTAVGPCGWGFGVKERVVMVQPFFMGGDFKENFVKKKRGVRIELRA